MNNNNERVNFFDAQFLDTEDLVQEQYYLNTKIERLAENIAQFGVIEFKGLDVVPDPILASPIDRNQDISALGFTDFPRLQSNGRDRYKSSQLYQIFKAYSNNVQRVDLKLNLLSMDNTETSSLLIQIRSLQVPTNPLSPISSNIVFERVIPRADLPLLPDAGGTDNSLLMIDISSATDQKGVPLTVGQYYALYVAFPGQSVTEDVLRIYQSFDPATSTNTRLHSNILDYNDTSLNAILSTWFFNNETQQYEQGLRDQNGNLVQYTIFHTIWTAAVKVNQGTAYIKGNYQVENTTVSSDGLPVVVSEDQHRFVSILSDGILNHVLIRYTQSGVNSIVQPRTGTPVFQNYEDSSEVIVLSEPAFKEIENVALAEGVNPATNKEYPEAFEYPQDSGKFYFELARVIDRNTLSLNRIIDIDLSSVSNLVYKDWRFPNNSISSARALQIASQHPNDLVFYVDNVPVYIPRTLELQLSRKVSPGDTAIYVYPSGSQDAVALATQILSGASGGELPTITFEFGEITTYKFVAGIGDIDNDGYGDEIKLFGIPGTGDNSVKIYYEAGTKLLVQRTEDLAINTTVPSYETIESVELLLRMTTNNLKSFTMNSVREVTTGIINNVTGQPYRYRSYAVILTADAVNISPTTNINTFILDRTEITPNTFYNFVSTTGAGKKVFYQDYDRPVFTFVDSIQGKGDVREEQYTFEMTAGQRIVTIPENLVLGVNTGSTNLYESKYDINNDGSIDEKELVAFEATYGKALGDSGYDSRFDFNSNNIIDDNDRYQLETRIGAIANFTAPGTDGYGGIARDEHRIQAMVVYEQNNPLNKLRVINAASKQGETVVYFDEGATVSGTYVLEFGFSDALSPAQNQFVLLSDSNLEDTFTDLTSISIVNQGMVETNIQVIQIISIFDDTLQKYQNTFTVAPSFTDSGTYLVTTNWNENRLASINRNNRALMSDYEYNLRRHLGPFNMTHDQSNIDVTGESFFIQFNEQDSSWADGTFDASLEHTSGEHIADMFFNVFLFVQNPTEPNSKPTTSLWAWYNLPASLEDDKYGLKLQYNDYLFLTHRTQGKRLIGEFSNTVVAQPFGLADHQVALKPEYVDGDIKNDLSNLIVVRADYADQFVKPHTHLDESDGGVLNSSQVKFDDPEARFPLSGSVTDIIYYFQYLLTRPITNDNVSDDAGIEARKLNFEDTNFSNMLYNGSFEQWPLGINFDVDNDNPLVPGLEDDNDNSKLPLPWTKRTPEVVGQLSFLVRPAKLKNHDEFTASQDVSRYLGRNAVRVVDRSTQGNALVQYVKIGEELQERYVTASVFALSFLPNSTFIYIQCVDENDNLLEFTDGSQIQRSSFHTGEPSSIEAEFKYAWELLQVSTIIPAGTRTIIVGLQPKLTSTTNTTVFFDAASLVLGRLAPGYAPVGTSDSLELVSAATVIEKHCEWTASFTNLLKNSQFEGWSNEEDPYYYFYQGRLVKVWNVDVGIADRVENSDYIKSGNYSLLLEPTSIISQIIPFTMFEKVEEWKSRASTSITNDPIETYSKNSTRRIYLTFSAWVKSTSYLSTESAFYNALNKKCYLRIRAFDSSDVDVTNGRVKNALGYEGFPASSVVENESRRTGSLSVNPSLESVGPVFRRRDIFDEKGFEKLTLSVSYSSENIPDIADFDGYFKVEIVNSDASKVVYIDNAIAVEGKVVPVYTPKPILDSGRNQQLFGSLEILNSEQDAETLLIDSSRDFGVTVQTDSEQTNIRSDSIVIGGGSIPATTSQLSFGGDISSEGGLQYDRVLNTMKLNSGGSTRVFVSGSGNVGVGTTVPLTKLDVNGNIFSEGTQISGRTDSTTSLGSTSRRYANLYLASNIDYVSNLNFNSSGTKVTFTTTGRVGIGTTLPSANLNVVGDVRVSDGTTNVFQVNTSNVYDAEVIVAGDLAVYDSIMAGTDLVVNGATTLGGNLAINGTSIVGRLDGTTSLGSTTNRFANLYLASVINYNTSLSFSRSTNSNVKVVINSSGYVGIGTTDPTVELEVLGSFIVSNGVENVISVNAPDPYYPGAEVLIRGDLTTTGVVNCSSLESSVIDYSSDLNIKSSGVTKVTVTTLGRVGIGTTTPATNLDVNGGLIVRSGSTKYFEVNTTDPYAAEVVANTDVNVRGLLTVFDGLKVGSSTLLDTHGFIKPITSANADAPNNSIYYSTDLSKLAYKNPTGTVNALY